MIIIHRGHGGTGSILSSDGEMIKITYHTLTSSVAYFKNRLSSSI